MDFRSRRGYEPAAIIVEFMKEERERCLGLVRLIRDDHAFLVQNIENGVWPDEIEKPEDPFEDLM